MPTQHRSRPRTQDRSTASTGEALRSIFNRNFNVVACINLLVMTAYYLMFVTSTAYARATYGASLSSAGLTAGIMVIGCLIGRFLTGNLLSLCGCRAILFAGLLLYSASIAAFFWVPNLALLFVQRLCMGMGVGIMGTATGTIVAYVVPHQHHGLGISLFSMSTAFALALGPFLGILISQYFSYTVLAQTCLGIGLACIAIFFGLHDLPEMRHRHRPFLELNSYIDPRVVRFSLVALITCLSYGCIQAFMTSYAAERGLTGAASLFFLLYALAALVTRPLTGRLFDLRGENIIFYPALSLTALSLTMMSHANSSWVLLAAGLILGMGFGNFQSAGQAVSLSLVSKSRFAQATTTFFIFFDLGIGLGPYLFGFMIPAAGYDGMYQNPGLRGPWCGGAVLRPPRPPRGRRIDISFPRETASSISRTMPKRRVPPAFLFSAAALPPGPYAGRSKSRVPPCRARQGEPRETCSVRIRALFRRSRPVPVADAGADTAAPPRPAGNGPPPRSPGGHKKPGLPCSVH